MKEDILKNALEASLDNEFDELSMEDIPDYDFSPEFLSKMENLVKSQDKPRERSHFKAVWVTAMSAAVAAVCIIVGAYNEGYLRRDPEPSTEIITTENVVTTVSSGSARSATITTSDVINKNTEVSEKTNVTTAATGISAHTDKTASATSLKQTSAVGSNRISDTTANVASESTPVRTSASEVPVTVMTTVSTAETTAVTSVTSEKGESDMKKYSKKKYAALISAISIAAGSGGVVSSAEDNVPVINDETASLLYIAENPTLMDFDGSGSFDTYDAYAVYAYLHDKAVLTEECAENIEKNADVNKDGAVDETDSEFISRYCYDEYLIENYEAQEWDASSYPYGSDDLAAGFIQQLDSFEESEYDKYNAAYAEMEYLQFVRSVDLGEIDLDINNDGKIDLYDLYDVYLYSIANNENSFFNLINSGNFEDSEKIDISAEEIDRIYEKCDQIVPYDLGTDELDRIARYILTHNDITAEETTAEYYTRPYGSIKILDEKVEEQFVNSLMNWMKEYVKVNNKFDKYEIMTSGDFVYKKYSDHAEICAYGGNSEEIEIPSEIDGCAVTTIGVLSFCYNETLRNVTIPETVTEIQNSAFEGCGNLGDISFPENLKVIGERAFAYSGIEKVCIPDSVTEVGDYAFSECRSLLEAVLPEKNVKLGDGVFAYCNVLKNVNLPVDSTSINNHMFIECEELEQIIIPSGVTKIEDSAFEYCHSLKSVNIPESVSEIGKYAFSCCFDLSEVNIPNSVKEIGIGAFRYCMSLTEISIPGSVSVIHAYTFDNCENLAKIELNEGIKTIDMFAFRNSANIESVTIPKSVDTLSLVALSKVKTLNMYDENGELRSVKNNASYRTIDPKTNDWKTSGQMTETISWNIDENGTLIISGKGKMCDYSGGLYSDVLGYSPFYLNENIKNVIIEEGITGIGNYTFKECKNLRSVTLPSTLSDIPMGAFANTGLTEVTIPNGVKKLIQDCFAGCTQLKKVTLPDGLKMIGFSAFNGCRALSDINIPETVDTIDDYAFADCTSLKSINIPDKVERIYFRTFMNCTALEDITFGKGITQIQNGALNNTKWLADRKEESGMVIVNNILIDGKECTGNVIIPDGVKCIAEGAFEGSRITDIVMPDSVVSIGDNAFGRCSKLSSVKLSQNLTDIGEYAFSRCTSLTRIELPDSLSVIDQYVFAENGNLVKVVLPKNINDIGYNAFNGCYRLESIFIPKKIMNISDGAFEGCSNLVIQSDDNVYVRKYAENAKIKYEYVESAPLALRQTTAGDANCDGKVNMADVVIIMQSIANPDKYNLNGADATHITLQGITNGDMDGNGITNYDAVVIQKKLLGLDQ